MPDKSRPTPFDPRPFDPQMVLIDLDGTLVDSVPDLTHSVDEMMAALDRPPHGEAAVRNWVGNGVERLVQRALTGQLDGEPDPADYERAYPIFLELYSAHNGEHARLYPGVVEGLKALRKRGLKLGCVTNKAARFTEPLLENLGIADNFGIIISGDSLSEKKPSPLPLLHAAEHFGVTPPQSLMLGDSISDVKAARAAGFPVVCVSYGYNHGHDIREAVPDAVIDSLTELDGLLVEQRA
ncbi:MAG: phosphoglycolate phosphatase [Thiohalocapsa sp.]|jgi:phosphoglycolate phosphatase|uniref:phosphoglycolate phosphatase n=1 Tax=Thiohalocapsa sp. TaxID=2497641 RepID=UPI0025F8951E|nr:phosphoglycolate phosphatase [Thiohalocapsa sp.]MCG6940326.1 phosphoglycolate phosphatase [Thiohalocapsa sp.]